MTFLLLFHIERSDELEKENLDYLRKKLADRKVRVDTRYRYYDMKYQEPHTSFTMPPQIRDRFKSTVGWTSKAVDALADRLSFRDFDNDNFNINKIFQMNNPDTLFDSAILSALIASCAFVYIIDDEEFPKLQVIEASNATGKIDPITGLLEEGYAVLERDIYGNAKVEAYFEPFKTTIITDGNAVEYPHTAPAPLLVPIIHRPDAVRPFGRSRITRGAIYWQSYAKRTLERSDVTAEFYSFPQKYAVGTSDEAEPLDGWRASISAMLEITKDENGDKPTLGQFSAPSMQPFMEQLRIAASGFAGETGLTMDDLGFVTDNPSSAEAIKASHETLRITARKAQRNFGSGFLNVGFLSACLRDGVTYKRNQFTETKAKWEPIFEPDLSALSTAGDGIIKINQAVPNYFSINNLKDLLGIEGDEQVGSRYIGGTTGENSSDISEEVWNKPESTELT